MTNFSTETLPVIRHRRKVISRAGHYLLRSKSDSDQHSGGYARGQGSSSADGTHRKGRGSSQSDGDVGGWSIRDMKRNGRFDNHRYGNRNLRYSSSRRRGGKRGSTRIPISQSLKMEIGQYALSKGAKEASDKYSRRVGRQLKERIIEKFARRFRVKQQRRHDRMKEKRQRNVELY